jgi:hypothetical protein
MSSAIYSLDSRKEVNKMSQHMLVHNGKSYQYGYDGALQQYYITMIDEEDGYVALCGPLAETYGDKTGFYQVLEQEGLLDVVPTIHRYAVAVDLPF